MKFSYETKVIDIYNKEGQKIGGMNYWLCKKCELLRTNKHTHKHGEELPSDVIEMLKKWEEEDEKRKSQKAGADSESSIQQEGSPVRMGNDRDREIKDSPEDGKADSKRQES